MVVQPALFLKHSTELTRLLDDPRIRFAPGERRRKPAANPHRKPRQVQRRLDPEQVSELLARHKSGESAASLATLFQVDVGTVRAHIERGGVERQA